MPLHWRLQCLPTLLLPLLFLSLPPWVPQCSATPTALVGINYGRVGNNLPPPSAVPTLLASLGIGRVRLYDTDPSVLRAFANTGVELVVGLTDRCVEGVTTPDGAMAWIKGNIQPYVPATKISMITVGNEVLTGNNTAYSRLLLPAMQCLHDALATCSLGNIAVTTAHSLAILATSYPPSTTYFRKDLLPVICPILDFHAKTGSPFMINAYPYFAYVAQPNHVDIEYVLLEPGYSGILDNGTGLTYPNMLLAQVDAVYHAINAAGGDSAKKIEVRISETGWPSVGDSNEHGASPENAAKYNSNVMRLVAQNKGTPLRPGVTLRAYVFALFNENQKDGPTSERNYGLFKPDGTPVYPLGYSLPADNSTSGMNGGGTSGGFGYGGNSTSGPPDDGYYSISGAIALRWQWQRVMGGTIGACAFGVLSLLY
ncbi:glucan endo-1,3-beta-glucosidase 10-like [Carex rostrata]